MSLYLTGSSGFVGVNVLRYFKNAFLIKKYKRGEKIVINQDIVIHLAARSVDSKKTKNSQKYYDVNTNFTKKVFDAFLKSNAHTFIMFSSVKAVANKSKVKLTESSKPNPTSDYGKSKLLAEQYINSKKNQHQKRVYILRPCLIHGPGNKGNLNLLFKLVSNGIPWPLGSFNNRRSFCSIENLLFVVKELISRDDIPSDTYNISDDEAISTNNVILLIAKSLNKKPRILKLPKRLITFFFKIGDKLSISFNLDYLSKLTDSYVICNKKINNVIGKRFPISTKEGLLNTFIYFKKC